MNHMATPMNEDLQVGVENESTTIRSVIERYKNRPNACTIFTPDSGEETRPATWIRATDGSYVDLIMYR